MSDFSKKNQSPLNRAMEMSRQAAALGFDWSHPLAVLEKVKEEVQEIEEAITQQQKNQIEEEIGDLIFATINLARHCKIDWDNALEKTNQKFEKRFRYIVQQIAEARQDGKQLTLDEMEKKWTEAKLTEKKHEKN